MLSNKLKLNGEKTEIMIVGTHAKVQALKTSKITVCDEQIEVSHNVKNLGIVVDTNLTMEKHISHIRKVCYFELRKIAKIRPFFTVEATNKLICAFVLSRLDYCNSLMVGLPDNKIYKLQQVQNNAARLVSRTTKRDHITPILKDLHWLPVKSRIEYKILSIVFQAQYDPLFPNYI